MGRPTPGEYVIHYACAYLNAKNAQKAARGAPAEVQDARAEDSRRAEQKLLNSAEIFMKKNQF